MTFPLTLRQEIENLLQGQKVSVLAKNYEQLSSRYRGNKSSSASLLTTYQEALSYATARMPATYGAVSSALDKVLQLIDTAPKTMLDVGAGTGACGWAVCEKINLQQLICLEREPMMRQIGQNLMQKSETPVLHKAQWFDGDLLKSAIFPSADLVTASYVLNELGSNALSVAEKLWKTTAQILLLIEPGTPKDFKQLLQIRDKLIEQGAYVVAPCPHIGKCPLVGENWCHFSARIERSRLHKLVKGADMGYEDEKYCFMAFSRQPLQISYQRILDIPKIEKNQICAAVCTPQGKYMNYSVSAKDTEKYKKAKKWRWGDILS